MIPGISAMTNPFLSPRSTTPRFGTSVVKWYAAIFGRAFVTLARNVDFPTLGYPTRPTSAIHLSSRSTVSSFAGCPGCAYFGACMVDVTYVLFPRPPCPPFKNTTGSFLYAISSMTFPVSESFTTVPGGTLSTMSAPLLPWQFFLPPSSPSPALYFVTCL